MVGAASVASGTKLESFPQGFLNVQDMVSAVADRLKSTTDQLREAIDTMGQLDPISEDLLIETCSNLEKHLWMVQAQEVT